MGLIDERKNRKEMIFEKPSQFTMTTSDAVVERLVEGVEEVKPDPKPLKMGKVNCKLLNFRKEGSKKAEVVRTLDEGAEVEIVKDEGEWLKVRHNGVEGFVMSKFID